jgi:starch synthase
MTDRSLRVLFATSECAPLVKTGGLGDVSAALPAALRRLSIDARVLLPGYPAVLASVRRTDTRDLPFVDALPDGKCRLVEAALPNGVPLIVVDHASAYDRPGDPYQSDAGGDWPDNPVRFGLLSKIAAMLAGPASPLAWQPDIVHCNDWQTALAPAYLRFTPPPVRCGTVQTIHNLAYQGSFAPDWVDRLGLPPESYASDGVEFHGRLSFLKAGLYYASAITTVSPTYAREIQSEALGFGMEGLLRWRRDVLTGILNGIDTEEWNPATDLLIPKRYDASTLQAKATNKQALQRTMGLAGEPGIPVLGVISRFIEQKGLDLLLAVAPRVASLPAQLAVLGQGTAELERGFARLAGDHPGRVAVRIGFDNELAHLIEAGCDLFVMPSRFEPCGMNQMYSQRYGTPPIVRATGGLVDSVVDCTPATLAAGTATGFAFTDPSADVLRSAIERAVGTYRDARTWREVQRNGMARNFGWDAAARQYADVYRRVANA